MIYKAKKHMLTYELQFFQLTKYMYILDLLQKIEKYG